MWKTTLKIAFLAVIVGEFFGCGGMISESEPAQDFQPDQAEADAVPYPQPEPAPAPEPASEPEPEPEPEPKHKRRQRQDSVKVESQPHSPTGSGECSIKMSGPGAGWCENDKKPQKGAVVVNGPLEMPLYGDHEEVEAIVGTETIEELKNYIKNQESKKRQTIGQDKLGTNQKKPLLLSTRISAKLMGEKDEFEITEVTEGKILPLSEEISEQNWVWKIKALKPGNGLKLQVVISAHNLDKDVIWNVSTTDIFMNVTMSVPIDHMRYLAAQYPEFFAPAAILPILIGFFRKRFWEFLRAISRNSKRPERKSKTGVEKILSLRFYSSTPPPSPRESKGPDVPGTKKQAP